jgi:mRNA interferase HigB
MGENHNELKDDFPNADYVTNNRYVFNIKGNSYRIVVVLIFFAGEVNIRFAGTHAEYNKIDAKII